MFTYTYTQTYVYTFTYPSRRRLYKALIHAYMRCTPLQMGIHTGGISSANQSPTVHMTII